MFRSARVAIMALDDKATAYLAGTDRNIPCIEFGKGSDSHEIALCGEFDHATWLRSLAAQLEELAEQVEQSASRTDCTCGTDATSLDPDEVVVHRRDGQPCYITGADPGSALAERDIAEAKAQAGIA